MKQSDESATFRVYLKDVASTSSINFKAVLGDMYYKYDKFKIICNNYACWNNVTAFNGGNYTSVRLTGLNFLNSTYENTSGSSNGLTATATFPAVFQLLSSAYSTSNFTSTNGLIFSRPTQEFTNLTFEFCLAISNINALLAPSPAGYSFAMWTSYTIYGLYED